MPKLSLNDVHVDSSTFSDSSIAAGDNFTSPAEYTSLIAALRQECDVLREEVTRLKARTRDERTTTNEGELLREIKTLQLERQKLKNVLKSRRLQFTSSRCKKTRKKRATKSKASYVATNRSGLILVCHPVRKVTRRQEAIQRLVVGDCLMGRIVIHYVNQALDSGYPKVNDYQTAQEAAVL